jgi:hypothetical protein
MKYIKTYEIKILQTNTLLGTQSDNSNKDVKYIVCKDVKYIVWDAKFIYAILIKITSSTAKLITLKRLYLYDFENNVLKGSTDDFFEVTTDEFKNNVIFQSDSLEEVIKNLPELKYTTKYNI